MSDAHKRIYLFTQHLGRVQFIRYKARKSKVKMGGGTEALLYRMLRCPAPELIRIFRALKREKNPISYCVFEVELLRLRLSHSI